jgi:hypothetical protein
MKTVTTLCLVTVLSLVCSLNLSAQNSTASFTAPSPSSIAVNAPARITTFSGRINNEKVLLNWSVEENQAANQFEVEKSINGSDFKMAALVFGTDKKSTDNYMFYEKAKDAKTSYRIKIILTNGSIAYSPVITPGSANNTNN